MPTSANSLVRKTYAVVVAALCAEAGVSQGASTRGFGAGTLRAHGKIFAMLASRERFVVKLPQARVAELLENGAGAPFDMGHGRVMRERVVITAADPSRRIALAREAWLHVAESSRQPSSKQRGRSS